MSIIVDAHTTSVCSDCKLCCPWYRFTCFNGCYRSLKGFHQFRTAMATIRSAWQRTTCFGSGANRRTRCAVPSRNAGPNRGAEPIQTGGPVYLRTGSVIRLYAPGPGISAHLSDTKRIDEQNNTKPNLGFCRDDHMCSVTHPKPESTCSACPVVRPSDLFPAILGVFCSE
jgi:hypothetical protein